MSQFLPITRAEMHQKGWDQLDIILITGDAYIDHPSFGAALIGRYLESKGYRVGILPQPDWKGDADFQALGQPRLFFGITAGNMDSMISNRTSEKNRRKADAYSEGGVPGKRPDRATLVYCNKIRQLFPGVPIVIGGLEASLRRLVHYDYWDNSLRRSILFDCRADILVYGMAERAIVEIAQRLEAGTPLEGIVNTARILGEKPEGEDIVELPSYETILSQKHALMTATVRYERELAGKNPPRVMQACQNRYLLLESPQNLPADDLDSIYTELPFVRQAHPRYLQPIPANGFVKDSIVSHRGCYGGCSFCALTVHQGKYISSRSESSILKETNLIASSEDFKGTIQDVGGPSANMYGSLCKRDQGCARFSCLHPHPCPNLQT
ncbi:MAG: YgiQ family radical SAM protein, partial [Candidatus Margulisiibacteriota bacterium]